MQSASLVVFLLRSRSTGITSRGGGATASRYADQSHPREAIGDIGTALEDAKAHRPRQCWVPGLLRMSA
ncbi:hypothetical protein [Methylobacterium sp. E-045]|uniref:hypothetical protein n=1 Tax=Methylobacterium sp. E-045 TaxID=2836575 RepID=UPI001FBA0615|nr:hypothetical protein [Methylobacterium sp. E-045]